MEQIEICGVRIDGVTLDDALEVALEDRAGACVVVTPNALMLERCRRERELAGLLNRATLSLPDGVGVLRAAKKRGVRLPARVAGIAFGEALLICAAERGLRVCFLGGADGVAEEAAKRMRERLPDLQICGAYSGYFDHTGEENERLIEALQLVKPDVLLVCFGFPLQERWIFRNVERLPSVRIAAGLGGSFDVWSGRVRRAPKVVQHLSLEWAWRMMCEPKRLLQLPSLLRFFLLGGRE